MFDLRKAKIEGYKKYFKENPLKDFLTPEDYYREGVQEFFESSFLSAVKDNDIDTVKFLSMLINLKYSSKKTEFFFREKLQEFDQFWKNFNNDFYEDESIISLMIKDELYSIAKHSIKESFDFLNKNQSDLKNVSSFFEPSLIEQTIRTTTLLDININLF